MMKTISNSHASEVIFWNIWGHRNPEQLHDFLQAQSANTDIFCLTEVTDIDAQALVDFDTEQVHGTRADENPQLVNGFEKLQQLLSSDFTLMYHSPTRDDWTCEQTKLKFPKIGFGSALIVSKNVPVIAQGAKFVCQGIEGVKPRVLQWVVYEKNRHRYLVAHLHGAWIKENTKGDHPVRTTQSQQTRMLLQHITSEYDVEKIVFGGDLNLDMNTEALRLLCTGQDESDLTLRNLIEEHAVTCTRTKSYRKFGEPGESMFADYVLVSKEVVVERFSVFADETASDHAPLKVHFY
jgi:endonuclease/exonuclease/phosphatase family metal-dependent hydrolase